MKQLKLTALDGSDVFAAVWDNVKKPKGVFVLVHDLKETLSYYNNFAQFLNDNNYVCAAQFLRLHEKDNKKNENKTNDENLLNLPHNYDFFKENVNDLYLLTKIMSESFNCPIYVVGVGFGAYMALRLLEISDFANKVVLIGTGYPHLIYLKTTKPISFGLQVFSKRHNFAKQIERLIFAPLEMKDKNYLTTDEQLFEKLSQENNYVNLLPYNYYYSYLNNLPTNDKNFANINPKTEFLLLSGLLDPVSRNGKTPIKLQNNLSSFGLKNHLILFDDCKHSLLLEKNAFNIYQIILDFVQENLVFDNNN